MNPRQIRIDKNERGQFECWEPDGMGPGKHALFDTQPTMELAVARVMKDHPDAKQEYVHEDAALFFLPEPKPETGLETVSRVTGLSQADIKTLWEQVKANHKLLDECKGHDFSRPFEKRGEMVVKWQCSRCGGTVDGQAKRWYERGLQHGLRRG